MLSSLEMLSAAVAVDPRDTARRTQALLALSETYDEIGRLADLEEDWNDEGAPSIDRTSIVRAQVFLQSLACILEIQDLSGDFAPHVFPTIKGGVDLYWQTRDGQVGLSFGPHQSSIVLMESRMGRPAKFRTVPADEAASVAMATMREFM